VGLGKGFGTEKDEVIVLDRNGVMRKLGPMHKRELAREILNIYVTINNIKSIKGNAFNHLF
jgi:phosphopantothenoylcysteine decarboxylase/phosphopantothenate--cysteine ligase